MDVQALSGTDIKWVDTTLGNAPWPCAARNGDLATKTAVMVGATVVIAKGCVTAGDKGGGMFYWNPSSTESDNGGTVVDTTCLPVRHSGRWIRIYDGLMDVRWFGARGDGTPMTLKRSRRLSTKFAFVVVRCSSRRGATSSRLRLMPGPVRAFATSEAPRRHVAPTFQRTEMSSSGPPPWCGWAVGWHTFSSNGADLTASSTASGSRVVGTARPILRALGS